MPHEIQKSIEEPKELDLSWAEDVLRAAEFLGRRVPRSKLKTSRCKFLHDWAGNPENLADFLKNLVPKAADIVAKQKKDNPKAAEMIAGERKAISELKNLLVEAVRASQLIET